MFKYFLSNYSKTDYENFLRARALLILDFAGIVLILLNIAIVLFTNDYRDSVERKLLLPIVILFIFISDLIILKLSKKSYLAGSYFVTFLIFTHISFLYLFAEGAELAYFHAAFYHLLIFFSLSALFSSRIFIFVNIGLFYLGVNLIINRIIGGLNDDYLLHLASHGRLHYQLVFFVFSAVVFSFRWLTEIAYRKIKLDIGNIESDNQKLQELIKGIKENSLLVSDMASELKLSAQKVSNGSSKQASSNEEISSSLIESVASMSEVLRLIELTNQSAISTKQSLDENISIFDKTTESVAQIRLKRDEIDDIADQTEILAINSAIEASRTNNIFGGFGVISKEIKVLAEKTQFTSSEILKLIGESLEYSKISSSKGMEIKELMSELQTQIKSIETIILEQKISLNQISNGMEQINHASQNNATVSQNLILLVDSLQAKAKLLNEKVSL